MLPFICLVSVSFSHCMTRLCFRLGTIGLFNAEKAQRSQRCWFYIQPTSLVSPTFEFNLHLTSAHVFFNSSPLRHPGALCALPAPCALKPSSYVLGDWKCPAYYSNDTLPHRAPLFFLLSLSLRPLLLPHIIFEDNWRLEDKNTGCGACRHCLLSPDLNKELWN